MKAHVTTDAVMQLCRGPVTRLFSYEEWVCARLMYVTAQVQPTSLEILFADERGSLGENAVRELRHWLGVVAETVATRELSSSIRHGAHAAGGELFLLAQKVWKLPYRHTTDSTDTVRIGSRRVSDYGSAEAPPVPRLGEVKAFRDALAALAELAASEAGTLEFEAVGKRYLADRR